MSTAIVNPVATVAPAAPARPRLELASQYQPAATTSFGRLLAMELRKLGNTLASRVLLIVGVLVTALAILANLLIGKWAQDQTPPPGAEPLGPLTVLEMVNGSASVITFVAVIIGIMSITSEWSQRTSLATFALEPRRGRVLAAKVVVLVGVVTLLVALTIPLSYGGLALGQAMGAKVAWGLSLTKVAITWFTTMLSLFFGIGFALATLSTPMAITGYFVVPILLGFATSMGQLWEPLTKVMPWIDPNNAPRHLVSPEMVGEMTATNWWQLLVSNALWVGIPLILGTLRWLRREVK